MTKKVKTSRGADLDFDLLRIKEEISTAPQSLHVQNRKNYIEQRLRRRVKSALNNLPEAPKEEEKKVYEKAVEPLTVEAKEETAKDLLIEEQEVVKEEPKKKTTRQRARRKSTPNIAGDDDVNSESDS